MYKSYSMELAGRTLTVDIGRVAKQANGAALMHYGDTTVLSTATASKEPREGIRRKNVCRRQNPGRIQQERRKGK